MSNRKSVEEQVQEEIEGLNKVNDAEEIRTIYVKYGLNPPDLEVINVARS